jgi:hypothetical protein
MTDVQAIEAEATKKSVAKKPKKPTTKKPAAKSAKPDVVTLAELCKELKIDSYDARVKLRAIDPKEYPELAKAHKPKKAWEFAKGSAALKEARAVLTAKE